MRAWLERLDAVEAHTRWAAPYDYIAVFEEDAFRLVDALQTAQQEDALETEGDGDDGLRHIAFVPVLVHPQFGASLVSIDVAGVGAEMREAGSDGATDGEIMQNARHGRPFASYFGARPVSSPIRKSARSPAIGDHHRHWQAAGCHGIVQGTGGDDLFNCGEEFPILRQGQTPHEHGAGEDFLMRRLHFELGEEVHRRTKSSYQKRRILGENNHEPYNERKLWKRGNESV